VSLDRSQYLGHVLGRVDVTERPPLELVANVAEHLAQRRVGEPDLPSLDVHHSNA
jgi:hypothetical protein